MTVSDYGDRHADVYDRIYGNRFAPDDAVATIAGASQGGTVLELGLGTGRLAIPLTARGVPVEGIEASTEMINKLRAQPGGENVPVHQVDLAGFDLPRHDYTTAVCAVSTLFMLPGRAAQQALFDSTARHLQPGGALFIEAFRPDPARFGADGSRSEDRSGPHGYHHVHSRHDLRRQTITITHTLDAPGHSRDSYEVTLHYATEDQLDHMATRAGFQRTDHAHRVFPSVAY